MKVEGGEEGPIVGVLQYQCISADLNIQHATNIEHSNTGWFSRCLQLGSLMETMLSLGCVCQIEADMQHRLIDLNGHG